MFHKLFLLISAGIIFHGVAVTMTAGGSFDLATLKFFTILSNLLLGIAFIVRLVRYRQNDTQYLSFSAIIAIAVTCLVYNFVLVPFGGADNVFSGYGNFATHLLAGVLAFANYFFFEDKGSFRYKHVPVSVAFPAVYWLVFVTDIIDFYPYFFMNPNQIGWLRAIAWFGLYLLIFGIIALGLVRLDSSEKASKICAKIYAALLGAAAAFAIIAVLLFGGVMLLFTYATRPRPIEPHQQYFALANSTDIPIEGITIEPGISLYINLRGNSVTFQTHERDHVLVTYRLSSHSIYHQPVYEITHATEGIWLRIADEIRSSGRGQFKNSTPPEGDITIFVPANAGEIFYILEIAGQDNIGWSNAIPLESIAESVVNNHD